MSNDEDPFAAIAASFGPEYSAQWRATIGIERAAELRSEFVAATHFRYTDQQWAAIAASHPGGQPQTSERDTLERYAGLHRGETQTHRNISLRSIGSRAQLHIRHQIDILFEAGDIPSSWDQDSSEEERARHLAWLARAIVFRLEGEKRTAELIAAEPSAGRTKGVERVRRYLEMLYAYYLTRSGARATITTHPDGRAPSGPVVTFVRACAAPVVATKDQKSITPDALRECFRKWVRVYKLRRSLVL